ncbi:MAG: molybdopterin-dependent oxidoreductase, partial [Novosphingobium sp.]|nr:molybdopterin-dependent oxidoreductase [Novosphingobium sp.]
TEDYYVANKLAKGFIGTANIDTNSRLCMASAVAAHTRAFGEDVVPVSYADLDAADLILLVGSNTAWCHPVIWQRIEKTRERRGTKIVVIDPRKTETAERADLHISVEPDGDVALFNALLAELRSRGLADDAFLADRCCVPDGFWDGLDVSGHGVPASQFARLVNLVAAHPRMITLFSQGANQSVSGTDKGNAIINLHLATGRINRHGAGPFSMTGQPNAMGGREVGGLASMLACHLGFSQAERDDAQAFWKSPAMCEAPGLKAVDLFRAVHDGRIRFLWIMATNPAVSMPDAGFVREAIARCPNVVVSDVIADTDTAKLAHIRLPALGWGEKDGTVTNSERRISRQRALFEAPGEARADWRIVSDVATRMGFADAFRYANAASVFREYAAMTALSVFHGKLLDLTAWAECSDADYDTMAPFQWGGEHPCKDRFPTPDGKARLVVVRALPARDGFGQFPLRLNTGRYRDQWHTMTRTGLSAKLANHRREPLVEVHPDDASAAHLQDGGLARVATAHGEALFRVLVSESQAKGQIFVPMHWTDMQGSAGRTGLLVEPSVDPHSGQPGFKDTAARIEAVVPEWRAFAVLRECVTPDALYWTRSRIEDGWLYEVAGIGSIDVGGLLPGGIRNEASDLKRGMHRVTISAEDGTLQAAVFVTRSGQLPDREWIARQLAHPDGSATELLAGRPSTPQPDRGPLVCLCFEVGEDQILSAAQDGACNVGEIGAATRAGTNCGSCRPTIARLLESCSRPLQEAAQ